ncbi:hypothetical protein GQ600_24738 [Phytophthora cactorum]|nr:hypothetical protein GQ600_24738 [Phytophthora cactorum]
MLSRLENVIYSIGTVSADVISYAGEKLNKCQISPPLSQDCVALFAHLSFVPFFTDLSVTELFHPEWMFAEQSNTTTMASFTSAMKRIQKRFEGFLGVQPEKASFSIPAKLQSLPLLLLYNESVEFEMHLAGAQEGIQGTVSRGGLLGFPPWLYEQSSITFTVHKCGLLGTTISLKVLESELPEPALKMVKIDYLAPIRTVTSKQSCI